MTDHKALIDKLLLVLNSDRFELMAEVYAEDVVDEYPQSGEVIRGRANIRAMLENYPGRSNQGIRGDVKTMHVQATDGFKAVAPAFAVVRVQGAGDTGSATIRARYPDGSYWWVVTIYALRNDRIAHSRSFFAPDFPAPEWRKPFVEPAAGR